MRMPEPGPSREIGSRPDVVAKLVLGGPRRIHVGLQHPAAAAQQPGACLRRAVRRADHTDPFTPLDRVLGVKQAEEPLPRVGRLPRALDANVPEPGRLRKPHRL